MASTLLSSWIGFSNLTREPMQRQICYLSFHMRMLKLEKDKDMQPEAWGLFGSRVAVIGK